MKKIVFIILPVVLFSCSNGDKEHTDSDAGQRLEIDTSTLQEAIIHNKNNNELLPDTSLKWPLLPKDSLIFNASSNQQDEVDKEYLLEDLKPVRENFKRINSINKWQKIVEKDMPDDVGKKKAGFYYDNIGLEKIIVSELNEDGQALSEYYFMKGELSFVIEQSYTYNKPVYIDEKTIAKYPEREVYAYDDVDVEVNRYYFRKGKMLHMISNLDCGAPFPDDVLNEESTRIKAQTKALLAAEKN